MFETQASRSDSATAMVCVVESAKQVCVVVVVVAVVIHIISIRLDREGERESTRSDRTQSLTHVIDIDQLWSSKLCSQSSPGEL